MTRLHAPIGEPYEVDPYEHGVESCTYQRFDVINSDGMDFYVSTFDRITKTEDGAPWNNDWDAYLTTPRCPNCGRPNPLLDNGWCAPCDATMQDYLNEDEEIELELLGYEQWLEGTGPWTGMGPESTEPHPL